MGGCGAQFLFSVSFGEEKRLGTETKFWACSGKTVTKSVDSISDFLEKEACG